DGTRDDQGDHSDAQPERVRREHRTRMSRKDRLPESDPETQDEEAAEDRPFVGSGDGPTFDGRQIGEERDRDQEEKRHRAPSRKGFSVDEAQDQNGGQGMGEQHEAEDQVLTDRGEDAFVPGRGPGAHDEERQRTGREGRLEPRSAAPNGQEGEEPAIRGNAQEDDDAREVHREPPRARTRRIVTMSAGRQLHREVPASRRSAADRNPAWRASSSVRSERKVRRASSIRRRANSVPVSYFARTTWATHGAVRSSERRGADADA